jgi:hypothetical protein
LSRIINNSGVAVRQAVQVRQQHHQVIQQNMRMQMMRRQNQLAAFAVTTKQAPPKTTSIGLEVTKTFTINQADLDNGMIQYEVLEDDQVIWSGLGNDPAEGLLKVIIRMVEGEDPADVPPEDRPDFS